jgi:diaphanous 1
MESTSPIVPVLLPSGAIHFAKVNPSDTGQDVIQVLLATEGVKSDILGDLEQTSSEAVDWEWALQHVRKHERGRAWQDEELDRLDDGS